jgi:RNA polymerase sigma-70 factor (ECF subfamily)
VTRHVEPETLDAELVAGAKQGDRAAFAEIYRRHAPAIYRFARHVCGSTAMAEDVVQDVFLVLMRDLDRYEAERAPLVTYLYGIARNICRRRLRWGWRHVELDDAVDPAAPGDLVTDLAGRERRHAVRAALAVLPVRYREVIVLCDLHELDYEAAARTLGVPVGTVRSRLHRGRQQLAARLSRRDAVPSPGHRAVWRRVW